MQPTFVITNPLTQLELERGKGELSWTITNTTPRQARGRLDLDIDLREGVDHAWFVIEEPQIRVFGPNETLAVNVGIEVPEGVDEQQPRVSLTISNVERPQEDFQIGPAVAVRKLHWLSGPPKKPWYTRWWFIMLMILLVLGIGGGGIAAWIAYVNRDPLKGKSLTEALTYVTEHELDLGEIEWAFDPTIREKQLIPSGSVLRSEITEGEASFTIQLWHEYDSADKLGFSRKQRTENVDVVLKKVVPLKESPLPLSNWLTFEDEKALTKAKENAVPIEFFEKEYTVSYDEDFEPADR